MTDDDALPTPEAVEAMIARLYTRPAAGKLGQELTAAAGMLNQLAKRATKAEAERDIWEERAARMQRERDEARMMYEGCSISDQQHIQEAAERIKKAESERDAVRKSLLDAIMYINMNEAPEELSIVMNQAYRAGITQAAIDAALKAQTSPQSPSQTATDHNPNL